MFCRTFKQPITSPGMENPEPVWSLPAWRSCSYPRRWLFLPFVSEAYNEKNGWGFLTSEELQARHGTTAVLTARYTSSGVWSAGLASSINLGSEGSEEKQFGTSSSHRRPIGSGAPPGALRTFGYRPKPLSRSFISAFVTTGTDRPNQASTVGPWPPVIRP